MLYVIQKRIPGRILTQHPKILALWKENEKQIDLLWRTDGANTETGFLEYREKDHSITDPCLIRQDVESQVSWSKIYYLYE